MISLKIGNAIQLLNAAIPTIGLCLLLRE